MIRLMRYARPYAWAALAVIALVAVQSISQLYLPALMGEIVDRGVATQDIPFIWSSGAKMLLVAAISAVAALIAGYLSARISSGFGRDLRSRVFGRVESFSLREFDEIGTASLIVRTTNDVTQIQGVSLMILRMVVMAPIMAVGGIIMAAAEDTGLSWVLLVAIPVLFLGMAVVALRGLPLFRVMQTKLDRLNLVLRERLTGVRVIRAFNRVDYEKRRFNDANYDLTATALTVHRLMSVLMPFMSFTLNLTTIAIVWFGAQRVSTGDLKVGSMMAFIQYAMQILMSLLMTAGIFVMLPRAAASAERVNQVLDSQPAIVDPPTPAQPDESAAGTLEFVGVTFNYPGAEAPALQDINLTIRPGETVAIIGGTGSGKSTLVNLIPRFYDVTKGQLLVDGVDVRQMTQAALRAKIGLVPQRAVLFTGTVADNIRYGKEDATDAEVREAATVAQAIDFIEAMPDGFASMITQGGTNVSGGQKQRISIARALVRRPPIYIFDDSFSALDFRTDARLRAALRKVTAGATTLTVTQRVGVAMDADRIVVLADGQVAGVGTHRELMRSSPVYREIVVSQLPEEEIA
jgi:ATP-binding cassette subfamily B protein